MLKQRVLTGSLLVALFATTILILNGQLFPWLLLIGTVIASYEWVKLAGISNGLSRVLISLFSGAVLITLFIGFPSHVASSVLVTAWISVFFWVAVVINFVVSPSRIWFLQIPMTTLISGLFLLGSVAVALAWLITQTNGVILLSTLIGIIVLADSGAYFFGKSIGKNKLAPAISPGKTIEGLFGGVFVAVLVVLLVALVLKVDFATFPVLLLLTILTALFSVVGDLFESSVKRNANVKDSGRILPGHGGVLDRFDGVLAATPVFILIQHYYPLPI